MNLLIDTNVVLDVLLNRKEFVNDSTAILKLPRRKFGLFVSASVITDIYYIVQKELHSKLVARELIRQVLKIVKVLYVSELEILRALDSNFDDFEDSVQNEVAISNNVDVIITRNSKDFVKSILNIYTPSEFLRKFA